MLPAVCSQTSRHDVRTQASRLVPADDPRQVQITFVHRARIQVDVRIEIGVNLTKSATVTSLAAAEIPSRDFNTHPSALKVKA